MPNSRLAKVERTSCFDRLQLLDPGDVDFSIRPCETQQHRATSSLKRLSAWIPIFDEVAGDQFGVVSIEVDLEKVISDYLLSLDAVSNSIYVIDSNDHLWVTRHDKSQCTSSQQTKSYLLEKCPELDPVFNGSRQILELEVRTGCQTVHFWNSGTRIRTLRCLHRLIWIAIKKRNGCRRCGGFDVRTFVINRVN